MEIVYVVNAEAAEIIHRYLDIMQWLIVGMIIPCAFLVGHYMLAIVKEVEKKRKK